MALNLVLDEGMNSQKIQDALNESKNYNAVCCLDCGFDQGDGDSALVYQTKNRRILVSKNIKHMNEVKFPPGGHNGIIAFHEQELTPDYILPRMDALFRLKLNTRAKNQVVKIYDERLELHTSQGCEKHEFKNNAKTKGLFK